MYWRCFSDCQKKKKSEKGDLWYSITKNMYASVYMVKNLFAYFFWISGKLHLWEVIIFQPSSNIEDFLERERECPAAQLFNHWLWLLEVILFEGYGDTSLWGGYVSELSFGTFGKSGTGGFLWLRAFSGTTFFGFPGDIPDLPILDCICLSLNYFECIL